MCPGIIFLLLHPEWPLGAYLEYPNAPDGAREGPKGQARKERERSGATGKPQRRRVGGGGIRFKSIISAGVKRALKVGAALISSVAMLTAGTAFAADLVGSTPSENVNITAPAEIDAAESENAGLESDAAAKSAAAGTDGDESETSQTNEVEESEKTTPDGGEIDVAGSDTEENPSNELSVEETDEIDDDSTELMSPESNDGLSTSKTANALNGDAADAATPAPLSVSQDQLAGHEIPTVSPRGTTINLFDYWRTKRTDNDTGMPTDWENEGINDDHTLKFGSSMQTNVPGGWCIVEKPQDSWKVDDRWCSQSENQSQRHWANANLGGSKPRTKIVAGVIGDDGYPQLSGNRDMVQGSTESLDYLFEPTSGEYKAAYPDVKNLLYVTEDGYYEFDAKQHYAEFDSKADLQSFVVYDKPAITNSSSNHYNDRLGQFFPFNSAEKAFTGVDEQGDLEYDPTENGALHSNSVDLNHFFGLTMTTQFVQQYGGHVDEEEGSAPVTYNFSGDDDVWVYIDGLLVGDLGGVHSAVALDIDFSTGVVIVYTDQNGNNDYDTGETVHSRTTIRAAMGTAAEGNTAKQQEIENLFTNDTLADNTTHTLQFFYLERGNTDSNMSLKFNLVVIPESSILKVDQDGTPLGNVEFQLCPANEDYQLEQVGTCYTGTTTSTGLMTIRSSADPHAAPAKLVDLKNISKNWVLKELAPRSGYRQNGDIHLRFSEKGQSENALLLVSNQWETGAYSQAHVTLRAGNEAYVYGQESSDHTVDLSKGTTFAVVLYLGDGKHQQPVSGSATTGWNISDIDATDTENSQSAKALIDAAASYGMNHIFEVRSNGSREATIEELPGDIETYYWRLVQAGESPELAKQEAKFTIGYYHTDADSLSDPDAATDLVRLQSNAVPEVGGIDGFQREFSVTLNIPNIKNELTLHKTDEEGNPLSGAEFALYADLDGNGQANDPEPLMASDLTTDGRGDVAIWSDTNQRILAKGQYVLVETQAPNGDYQLDTTPIKIVVDDTGVHVDAGTADDNVTVTTGLGTLVNSMRGFAANDKVDSTLYVVNAKPQTSDSTSYPTADSGWTDTTLSLQFQYENNDGDKVLDYSPATGQESSYTAKSGWSRLNVTQNDTGSQNKQDLQGQSLNNLFTGDVTVNVVNHPRQVTASFNIQKQLKGRDWKDTDGFEFTVTPADDMSQAIEDGDVILPVGTGANGAWGSGTDPVVIKNDTSLSGEGGASSTPHAVRYEVVIRKAGTYVFTVSETQGSVDNIRYSKAEFTVTVNVTNLSQTPTVKITAVDSNTADDLTDTMTFVNTYVAPVSALPLTGGDATARNLVLAGGGILLLAGIAWLLARRRRV